MALAQSIIILGGKKEGVEVLTRGLSGWGFGSDMAAIEASFESEPTVSTECTLQIPRITALWRLALLFYTFLGFHK